MSRREQRLERKFRGTLLCEACNRHTHVSMEFYKKAIETKHNLEAKGHNYIYFCKRGRCLRSRPETVGPPPRREYKERDHGSRRQ